MSFHLLFVILGDCILLTLMDFYAGVGIWESGSIRHILGMTLPSVVVWLAAAVIFRLYQMKFPAFPERVGFRQIPEVLRRLIDCQNPKRFAIVWLIGTVFSILWQRFYWSVILHSTHAWGLHIGIFLWYMPSCATFFIVWRGILTCLMMLSVYVKRVRWLRILTGCVGGLAFIYVIAIIALAIEYGPRIYDVDKLPKDGPRTALVFGAGVYRNGSPSAVLTDRVLTAVELYQKGYVDEMIMSGDNSDESRNEVDHMVRLAVENGVPESAVLRDDYGLHTAESCYNTKNVFGKDEVIFVSQDFHAIRILMTAESYGLGGLAVRADRRVYNIFSWGLWYLLDLLRLPIYRVHYF